MRKILGTLAALASLLLVGLTAGPASASLPTGYTGDGVVVNITGATLVGGRDVNVQIEAHRVVENVNVPVVCNSVTVNTVPALVESFSGGGSATYNLTLSTERVDTRTPTTITVTCNYTPVAANASLSTASQSCGPGCVTNSNTIVLLPVDGTGGGNNSGILPTTGSEIGLWLLIAGGVLVVGGTAVAIVARRRHA